MALRNYSCKCGEEWQRLHKDEDDTCPKCGRYARAKLPTELSTLVYELRDKSRGTQLRKNNEQKLRKRMNDHHDRNELAEKIDKHGMDDAQRNGWLKKVKKI
jgi:hypothetical protein